MDQQRGSGVLPSDLRRRLADIELALDAGDVEGARLHVEHARRTLEAGPARSPRRLRLVGGPALTDRETEALRCLTDGSLSQKDIARELNVTRNTVKTHLKSLYQKLGVHCRGEAVHRARELGLLPHHTVVVTARPLIGGSDATDLVPARVTA